MFSRWLQFGRDFHNFVNYGSLDRPDSVLLANALMSLVVRSPAKRHAISRIPSHFGLPENEDVMKLNLRQLWSEVQRKRSHFHGQSTFFLFLHSKKNEFIFGDGMLDSFAEQLNASTIKGFALVPLTPRLAVFFVVGRNVAYSKSNCGAIVAPNWLVDWLNEVTLQYSGKFVFLAHKPEPTSRWKPSGNFRMLKNHRDSVIDKLLLISSIFVFEDSD